jgi:hypothetical protein
VNTNNADAGRSRCLRHESFPVAIANRRLRDKGALNPRLRGVGESDPSSAWPCGAGAVYVIRGADGTFMYVGGSATSEKFTPFDTFNRGLARKYAYKFAAKDQTVNIDLFTFGPPPACPEIAELAAEIRVSRFIEAIEAEVVHFIRAATGSWPIDQHEIHFQPAKHIEAEVSFVRAKLKL